MPRGGENPLKYPRLKPSAGQAGQHLVLALHDVHQAELAAPAQQASGTLADLVQGSGQLMPGHGGLWVGVQAAGAHAVKGRVADDEPGRRIPT